MSRSSHDYETSLQLGSKVVLGAALFPVEKAKVLMQIGFEPLPPYRTRTIFGRPSLGLPNIFSYLRFMWKRDGWYGLYGGCTVSVLHQVTQALVYKNTTQMIVFQEDVNAMDTCSVTDDQYDRLYMMSTIRDLAGKMACIVVSQPLFVLQSRTIAQFIGQETHYSGVLCGIRSMYEEDGLSGFFAGLSPRLFSGFVSTLLVASAVYVINKYIDKTQEHKTYTTSASTFVVSALMYPYQVVSTCCAVSGCRLVAGNPPLMPRYSSWLHCFRDLKAKNQLKRGGSLFFRYYCGPQVVLGGQAIAVE